MSEQVPRFSRGVRIVFVVVASLAIIGAVPVAALALGYYRPFYIPSEAMEPTLKVGDRLVARMGVPEPLDRGDIVLVAVGHTTYVKRVAALPGDTIELIGGIVHLNGRAVGQRRVGEDRLAQPGPYGDTAIRIAEQFPGEDEPHRIYDFGYSPVDDFPLTRVPPGHVFLLGDNRDSSADSRVPREQMGVGGAVPIADIRGRPWWYYHLEGRSRPTPR